METTTRPAPLDDDADCPDCRANETHLLDMIDSLSTLVGWQTQRIARLEDTVRALGDEADRLVTERDEARHVVARGSRQIAVDVLADMARLRETIDQPAKPAEPTGVGAVVDAGGTIIVRGPENSTAYPYCWYDGARWCNWDRALAYGPVTVLSEGVQL